MKLTRCFAVHWIICFFLGLSTATATESRRPNVVLIIADDMNDFGFYGTLPGVKVPHLDSFEGLSLRPLLRNPNARCERPAFTMYEEHYFSARDQRYRYIQYPDGTEELYDHQVDPFEFQNLAGKEQFRNVKKRFQRWIPAKWAKSLGGREG